AGPVAMVEIARGKFDITRTLRAWPNEQGGLSTRSHQGVEDESPTWSLAQANVHPDADVFSPLSARCRRPRYAQWHSTLADATPDIFWSRLIRVGSEFDRRTAGFPGAGRGGAGATHPGGERPGPNEPCQLHAWR